MVRGVRPSPYVPELHVIVCTHDRGSQNPGDPLGPGCGARGLAVFDAAKEAVRRRGEITSVWITRARCLGICPSRGAGVACYRTSDTARPEASHGLFTEVEPGDVETLLDG